MPNSYQKIKYYFIHKLGKRLYGQVALIEKMKHYLALKDPSRSSETLLYTDGICHGLGVLNQVMKKLGKTALTHWRAALAQMVRWDGHARSLAAITLPFPGFPEPLTLDKAFEYAINYALFHHNPHHFIHAASQNNILDSNEKHFEIYFAKEAKEEKSDAPAKTIRHIQHAQSMAGHFSVATFLTLVNAATTEANLFLVTSRCHVMTLDYAADTQEWQVYDPNYPHDHPDRMERTFKTKTEAVNELMQRMRIFPMNLLDPQFGENGISAAIKIATWDDKPIPPNAVFENLVLKQPLTLAKQHGLEMFAYDCPERLVALLTHADFATKEGSQCLCHALSHTDFSHALLLSQNAQQLRHILSAPVFQQPAVQRAFAKSATRYLRLCLTGLALADMNGFLDLMDMDLFKQPPLQSLIHREMSTIRETDAVPLLHAIVSKSAESRAQWKTLLASDFIKPYVGLIDTLKDRRWRSPHDRVRLLLENYRQQDELEQRNTYVNFLSGQARPPLEYKYRP